MIKEKSGIYCIINLKNNKKYVGQSTNILRRQKEHIWELRNNKHHNDYLQNSWNLYGEENFVFAILEYCPINELNKKEVFYISKLKSDDRNFGFNLEAGGTENKDISPETKIRISQKLSELQTSTGFYRVSKHDCKSCEKGFRWRYGSKIEGEEIASTSLKKLKEKVISSGMEWKIIDEDLARESINEDAKKITKHYGNTGFNHVYKISCSKCDQGFKYEYKYKKHDKRTNFASVNLNKLKEKAKEKGLEWEIIDEKLALATLKEFQETQDKKICPGNTNYYRVYKKTQNGKPHYRYRCTKNGKEYSFQSKSIKELEKKVKEKGLKWEKIDKTKPDIEDDEIQTNSTGFYNVSKQKCKSCIKGYRWRYTYKKDKKTKEITSRSIEELKEKVKEKNLKWEIIDEEKAKIIMQKENAYIDKSFGNTGINHLYKFNCSNCRQGFIYEYRYSTKTEGKNKIQSTNLNTIKEKVKEKGLKWEIIDESLASKTIKDFKETHEEKSIPGNTNYFRVYKKTANGKPYYRYQYPKNGKQESIGSISIKELEKKVKEKGLKWEKIDKTKPDIKDNPIKTNKSGIYRVSKQKCKSCAKGYRWRYTYKQNSKTKEITAKNLKELKQKTLEKKLEWKITDKEKAKKSWELDKS